MVHALKMHVSYQFPWPKFTTLLGAECLLMTLSPYRKHQIYLLWVENVLVTTWNSLADISLLGIQVWWRKNVRKYLNMGNSYFHGYTIGCNGYKSVSVSVSLSVCLFPHIHLIDLCFFVSWNLLVDANTNNKFPIITLRCPDHSKYVNTMTDLAPCIARSAISVHSRHRNTVTSHPWFDVTGAVSRVGNHTTAIV